MRWSGASLVYGGDIKRLTFQELDITDVRSQRVACEVRRTQRRIEEEAFDVDNAAASTNPKALTPPGVLGQIDADQEVC